MEARDSSAQGRSGAVEHVPSWQGSDVGRQSSRRRRSSIGRGAGGAPEEEGPAKIGGMFGGLQDLKKVELGKEYNVFDFYKESGPFQWLAKHPTFENITLFVIAINAVWIGVDTEHNSAAVITEADPVFQVAENLFCVYFTGEVLIRFCAFKRKVDCLGDRWFKFDSCLVTMMIVETWVVPMALKGGGAGLGNLSILRLLRLLRLTRMVRLMRSVPEVLTLIKGMAAASRSVVSTMGLLVSFIYIFSIIFTQQYKGHLNKELEFHFGDMGHSILTLFVSGTVLDNLAFLTERILEDSWIMLAVFIAFVLLSSFTVLNMLIGILCEVVSATAVGEQERLLVREAKVRLTSVFQQLDEDQSGMINRGEFELMKTNEDATRALEALGVEPKHLFILSDTIFAADDDPNKESVADCGDDSKTPLLSDQQGAVGPTPVMNGDAGKADEDDSCDLSFEEFLEIVVHLRPGTSASVLDIADLRRALRQKTKSLSMAVRRIEEAQEEHDKLLREMKELCKSRQVNQTVQIVMPRRNRSSYYRTSRAGGRRPPSKNCRDATATKQRKNDVQFARIASPDAKGAMADVPVERQALLKNNVVASSSCSEERLSSDPRAPASPGFIMRSSSPECSRHLQEPQHAF